MRAPPITEPTAHLAVRRTLRFRVKRSLARSPKQGTSICTCFIEFPPKLWDKIVLLTFTCCLITFLHAFFGCGTVDRDLQASNDTFALLRASPWKEDAGEANGDEETRGVTRVTVDWHGNYELLPSTTTALISPASIPQDAFPDPTPALVAAGHVRPLDEGSLTTIAKSKALSIPFMFHGTSYDPFQLEFEYAVNGGRLYPIAGPPRTVASGTRTRRFGRCPSGEASSCL